MSYFYAITNHFKETSLISPTHLCWFLGNHFRSGNFLHLDEKQDAALFEPTHIYQTQRVLEANILLRTSISTHRAYMLGICAPMWSTQSTTTAYLNHVFTSFKKSSSWVHVLRLPCQSMSQSIYYPSLEQVVNCLNSPALHHCYYFLWIISWTCIQQAPGLLGRSRRVNLFSLEQQQRHIDAILKQIHTYQMT